MLILGHKKVDKFVQQQKELGNFIRWDTYLKTLVFFRPHPAALYSIDKAGKHNGVWNREASSYGFETRVEVNEKGLWEIDYRNVKRPEQHSKRTRS